MSLFPHGYGTYTYNLICPLLSISVRSSTAALLLLLLRLDTPRTHAHTAGFQVQVLPPNDMKKPNRIVVGMYAAEAVRIYVPYRTRTVKF